VLSLLPVPTEFFSHFDSNAMSSQYQYAVQAGKLQLLEPNPAEAISRENLASTSSQAFRTHVIDAQLSPIDAHLLSKMLEVIHASVCEIGKLPLTVKRLSSAIGTTFPGSDLSAPSFFGCSGRVRANPDRCD
jgi:hypothetical protein